MIDFIIGNNYVIPDTNDPDYAHMVGKSLELKNICLIGPIGPTLYQFYSDVDTTSLLFTKENLLTSNKLESNYGTATPIPKPKD